MNSMKQEEKDMKAEEKAYAKEQKKAEKARKAEIGKYTMVFAGVWLLKNQRLERGSEKYDLKGASAIVEDQHEYEKRITGGRILAGAVLFGPLGAIAGAMAKKDESTIIVTVTLADGEEVEIVTRKKHLPKAHKLVESINKVSQL